MERKQEYDTGTSKAAAWAWYQHGKGGFGIAGARTGSGVHRATRFKVEAMKERHDMDSVATAQEQVVFDCGSSLFDSYELSALSRQLDDVFARPSGHSEMSSHHQPHPHKNSHKLGKMVNSVLHRIHRPHGECDAGPAQADCECACREGDDCDCQDEVLHVPASPGRHGRDSSYSHHNACAAYAPGKHWSFRKLTRALLMLAHKPTSVSHLNDDVYVMELHPKSFKHRHHGHHYHHHHQPHVSHEQGKLGSHFLGYHAAY